VLVCKIHYITGVLAVKAAKTKVGGTSSLFSLYAADRKSFQRGGHPIRHPRGLKTSDWENGKTSEKKT